MLQTYIGMFASVDVESITVVTTTEITHEEKKNMA